MKILIINTLYAPYKIGGAEKSIQSLAESFVKKNVEVMVLTLGTENKRTILNGVIVEKVKIENTYWPFGTEVKSSVQKLLWHIKDVENTKYDKIITDLLVDFKPDVLFTNNLTGFSVRSWELAKNHGVKRVHTLRDYYLQCPKLTKYKNKQNCNKQCIDCKILSLQKKRYSKNVNAVVGISNYILENHIANGYFSNALQRVIFNGFSFNNTKENIKENTKEKKKGLIFGYIGQINQSKGVEFLLESFKNLEGNKEWKLVIAGKKDNKYIETLRKINSSNNITYIGYVDSNFFFKNIDVLIVPSVWQEPFGRVVLEGLIHKKIVLGSRTGGINELLNNNKDFLFTPNTNELKLILEKLLSTNDFAQKFNLNNEFLDRFLIDTITDQYIELFKELISN
jgi:glycosyltransferase involved in cell wall biosynthesis